MVESKQKNKKGYPGRDFEIVDYSMYQLKGTSMRFRGPEFANLQPGEYSVAIGSAHTFGCFCEHPYPSLLTEKLNLPVLNLGIGGAGPLFYLKRKKLIEIINNGNFIIIQIGSARGESNSLFESLEKGAKIRRRSDGALISSEQAYDRLIKTIDKNKLIEIINETRSNWINNYIKLFKLIKVPKILFFFSGRKPQYEDGYQNSWQLFNKFPQLVNSEMVEELQKYSNDYVECITNRGLPQQFISRFTGKPIELESLKGIKKTHNKYYPSPEMHIDAANTLSMVCKKYIK